MKAPFYASRRAVRLLDASYIKKQRLIAWGVCFGGALLAGTLLRATEQNIVPGPNGVRVLGWPLESAFALSTILALVVCFRTWERLFPTNVPSLYTLYPLQSSAVIQREIRGTTFDAICMATALVAWQLPSWALMRAPQIGYAVLFSILASLVTASLAYGVPVMFVRSALRSNDPLRRVSSAQVAASVASAVSFGVTVTTLLILKLGIEEVALALDTQALVPTLIENYREQQAWITRSAAYAVLLPVGIAALVSVLAIPMRLRHWLGDSTRIAAATAFTPELSYAWIDSRAEKQSDAQPLRLLTRRDTVRVQRAAPFRSWVAVLVTAVVCIFVLLGSPLTLWVSLSLFSVWLLAWLRVPSHVAAVWSDALTEWDSLLLDARTMRRARVLTMVRVVAPYGALLLLPGLAYTLIYANWLPAVFSALCCIALAAHATYSLRRQQNV